jgi:predicted nucleic acid-binding Zn ribbon protein
MAFSNPPESLGSVLQKLIDRMGLRDKIDGARIVEAWATVAGPQINGVTDSAWVKYGVLYVKINSAAWRHELHLRREAWRKRVNDHLDDDLVDEIVFR